MSVRVRIAPSPTGDPHVGTAYVALFNKAMALKHGGAFVLRIEDTDRERYREGSERAILESLAWLGLNWDEGPDKGGAFGPYRQSERLALYREHTDSLLDSGHAYRCFCTRERLDALRAEQERSKSSFRGYDRQCRALDAEPAQRRAEAGEPFVVRLKVPQPGEPLHEETGGACRWAEAVRGEIVKPWSDLQDQVILKSDGFPTYHLANVIDDHLMQISHVIRAEEWNDSVPLHWLLYRAFGWEPPVIAHLPLLRNADTSKISKRKNPVSLIYYRDTGYLPEALLNFLARQGYRFGGDREKFRFAELVESFALEKINTGGPVFDLDKLTDLNAQYLREKADADPDGLRQDVEAFAGRWLARLGAQATDRMAVLGDFFSDQSYYFARIARYAPEALLYKKRFDPAVLAPALGALRRAFGGLPAKKGNVPPCVGWTQPEIDAALDAVLVSRGWAEAKKDKTAFMQAVRVAISGSRTTPPLDATLAAMERSTVLHRLDRAVSALKSLSR